ncbi:MAG: metal ABC transporter permease, partial [Actinomycetota bacterium]|nr:metal ABC transporter permease [Actinomycetota bacterium]
MAELALPYPFDLGFMQRALLACISVGVFAPAIGVFLVQKRLSLIGDGIGHVAFAGVGAGLLAGWAPLWTALAFAVGGSLGIEWFRSRRRTSGDVALAILFYSGIALGVVLISAGDGLSANVLSYLFGQPLTVRPDEVRAIVLLGVVVVATVLALRRAMFSVVTDEEWSRVAGLPVGTLNSLMAVLTA